MIKDKETILFAKKIIKILIVSTILIYICAIFVFFIKTQSKPIMAGGLPNSNSINEKYESVFIKEIKDIVYFPRKFALVVVSIVVLITEIIIYIFLRIKQKRIK